MKDLFQAVQSKVSAILGSSDDKNLENPVGLDGIEFLEFTSPEPEKLHTVMENFGFRKIGVHKTKNV